MLRRMLKITNVALLPLLCTGILTACGGQKSSSDSEEASTSSAPINSPYASQGPIAYEGGQGAVVCREAEYATDNPDCAEYFAGRTKALANSPKYRDQHVGTLPEASAPTSDGRRTNMDWNGDDPRVNGK